VRQCEGGVLEWVSPVGITHRTEPATRFASFAGAAQA
jgi:hypothetical protein